MCHIERQEEEEEEVRLKAFLRSGCRQGYLCVSVESRDWRLFVRLAAI